jgi:glutamine amidotransferase
MQLLFEASEESPGAEGLGFLQGVIRRLDASRAKVPHIGWARLRFTAAEPAVPKPAWAYFVHSFAAAPEDRSCVTCWVDHGEPFPAVVRQGRLVGVQFHPEKSQGAGVRYLASLLGGEA